MAGDPKEIETLTRCLAQQAGYILHQQHVQKDLQEVYAKLDDTISKAGLERDK